MQLRRTLIIGILLLAFFAGGFISGIYYSGNLAETSNIPSSSSKDLSNKRLDLAETVPSKVVMGYVQDFRNPEEIDFTAFTHAFFLRPSRS